MYRSAPKSLRFQFDLNNAINDYGLGFATLGFPEVENLFRVLKICAAIAALNIKTHEIIKWLLKSEDHQTKVREAFTAPFEKRALLEKALHEEADLIRLAAKLHAASGLTARQTARLASLPISRRSAKEQRARLLEFLLLIEEQENKAYTLKLRCERHTTYQYGVYEPLDGDKLLQAKRVKSLLPAILQAESELEYEVESARLPTNMSNRFDVVLAFKLGVKTTGKVKVKETRYWEGKNKWSTTRRTIEIDITPSEAFEITEVKFKSGKGAEILPLK
jgi:hypothetical protein